MEEAERSNDYDVLLGDIFDRKLKEITARDAMKTDLERILLTLRKVDLIMQSDAPAFSKHTEKEAAQWMYGRRDKLLLEIEKSNACIDALTTQYYVVSAHYRGSHL